MTSQWHCHSANRKTLCNQYLIGSLYMAAIHDLINQIDDPLLRERLLREWQTAIRDRKFWSRLRRTST